MVELMGGTIGVASNPGTGTEFWVELEAVAPVARVRAERSERAASARQAPGPKDAEPVSTVLYVEDNPANLKLVEEIISFRPNLRLLSTPDAPLGVALARAHQPRVILMDINLTGLNGSDALKVLQGNPRTAHIPVIAITANAMPRDIAKGLADGFFRYITKPIYLDEFAEALDSALDVARSHLQGTLQ
jgi:CheY-like chemotaxis protein